MLGKKTLNAGTMGMLLVFALATIGVGYGLWSQALLIDGYVFTGEMDAELSLEEIDESDSFNDVCPTGGTTIGQDCDGDGELNDDMEAEGKDVADCSARLINPYTMQVVLRNTYPSFNCFIRWDVHNSGTIPIHVYAPDYFYKGVYMGSAINVPELHVNGWPPTCFRDVTQLEPSERAFCNLHIHVNQPAEENAEYRFEVRVFTRQWNEIVPPPWR
jgi:hypothetical protein